MLQTDYSVIVSSVFGDVTCGLTAQMYRSSYTPMCNVVDCI